MAVCGLHCRPNRKSKTGIAGEEAQRLEQDREDDADRGQDATAEQAISTILTTLSNGCGRGRAARRPDTPTKPPRPPKRGRDTKSPDVESLSARRHRSAPAAWRARSPATRPDRRRPSGCRGSRRRAPYRLRAADRPAAPRWRNLNSRGATAPQSDEQGKHRDERGGGGEQAVIGGQRVEPGRLSPPAPCPGGGREIDASTRRPGRGADRSGTSMPCPPGRQRPLVDSVDGRRPRPLAARSEHQALRSRRAMVCSALAASSCLVSPPSASGTRPLARQIAVVAHRLVGSVFGDELLSGREPRRMLLLEVDEERTGDLHRCRRRSLRRSGQRPRSRRP